MTLGTPFAVGALLAASVLVACSDEGPGTLRVQGAERLPDGTVQVLGGCAEDVTIVVEREPGTVTVTLRGDRIDGDCGTGATIPGGLDEGDVLVDGSTGDVVEVGVGR